MDYEAWAAARPMIFPYTPEHQAVSDGMGSVCDQNEWLEDAMLFNVFASRSARLRGLVDSIYSEVATQIRVSNKAKTKEVIKTVLINLWFARFMGKPLRYSRDRSAYGHHRRYGKIFLKYDRVIPVIDAMGHLGYIEQKQGFWVSDKEFGRQSRMWSTPKLWRHFMRYKLREPDFFNVQRPEDVIIQRDGSRHKTEVGYVNTRPIQRQREQLERYNAYLDEHTITAHLDDTVTVDYRFLAETLYYGLVNNSIIIDYITLSTEILYPIRPYIQLYPPIPYRPTKTDTLPYHSTLPTMTKKKLPERTSVVYLRDFMVQVAMLTNYLCDLARHVAMIPSEELVSVFLRERFPLREIGIERLGIRLVYEYLHRVYNRKSFKLGGRAYGALHQSIPKHLRPLIRIDGVPTVELDYSAYHILMLYHMEGIDYPDDPYLVCEGPAMRDTYKAVGLVSINADENDAYGGIRDELSDRGIPLPNRKKPLVSLVRTFSEAHKPIAKYLFSGIGLTLQNKDSDIMNAILVRLMDMGILGLSVYDSVIVQEQYRDILYEVMVTEYMAAMGGYRPRL